MTNPPAPFSCSYTPQFPQLLAELGCSLLLSTASAGNIVVLSAGSDGRVTQLVRAFPTASHIAVQDQRMAIATRDAVVVLANAASLASTYPRQPHTYDALFVPRAMYFTGDLDLQDMAWGADGLWAVSARLSSLGLVDAQHSFTPCWTSPAVDASTPDNRWQLNGLALVDGQPRYVTALGLADVTNGWRKQGATAGILLDVPGGEPIVGGLTMPHSPRVYADRLFVLLAARSELIVVDTARGTFETVVRLAGFLRGMTRCGDYLFIGASRLHRDHRLAGLSVAGQEHFTGVFAVHLPSGKVVGNIRYLSGREEISDVQALPGLRRPNVLAPDSPYALQAVVLPHTTYWLTDEANAQP